MGKLAASIISIYRALFAKKRFYRFHRSLYLLSLKGMGLLNSENDQVSGEDFFLRHTFPDLIPGERRPVVLDVGANEGNYASKVKQVYPNADVYALEPHPKTFKKLQLQAEKCGFRAYNIACGREGGQLELYDYLGTGETGTTHASMYRNVIEELRASEAISWKVQVTDLDQFIEEYRIQKVHLLKIDTEGHDFSVLQGSQGAINSGVIEIIHFEFNEMNVISRTSFKDFHDSLPQYRFFRMLPDGLVSLGEYVPVMHELFAYQNIVGIPQRRLSGQRAN